MSAEDKEDETRNAETRNQILQLQSEKARKQEVLERLKEKKKALEDELRTRNDDLRELKDRKVLEERKQRERSDARQKDSLEDEAVDLFMRDEVRVMLKERIPAFSVDDDDEEDDSEGEQKERKKEEEGGGKGLHESVLVSYLAERATDKEKLDEYYVTYRIDRDTTIEKLHRDACEFWGCSTEEYILCYCAVKVGESQNQELNLKNLMDEPDKPVQSTDILPPKFRAHLHLIQLKVFEKRQERLHNRDFNPFDDYGKTSKASTTESTDAVKSLKNSKIQDKENSDPFAVAFTGWPGIYNLVRYKERPPTRQWAKIRLRDVVVYTLLGILSGIILYIRIPYALDMRQGILQTMSAGVKGETDPLVTGSPYGFAGGSNPPVVNFETIRTHKEIWLWLSGSFAYQLFDPRSSFRTFYTPVGFLRIRHQMAAEREECRREEVPLELRGPCHYLEVMPDRYGTAPLIIDGEFIDMDKPNSGRYPGSDPLVWQEAKDYSFDMGGLIQLSYDGSGYVVDYDLRGQMMDNSYATFLQDLPLYQHKWVTKATRFLSVEFAVANFNLGQFANCMFMFEMPASGSVNPVVSIQAFAPRDSEDNVVLVLDILRGCLVLYIALVKVYFETKAKTAQGKSGFDYIFSFLGLVDECTVAIFAAMTYMRIRFKVPKPAELSKFYSYSYNGYVYDMFFTCEGIFFLLVMIRFCAYMRLNSHVLVIWKTFGRAFWMYGYYMCIFGPVIAATIVVAHAMYSPYVDFFSTWYQAIMTIVYFNKQDVDVDLMYSKQRFWTLPFLFFFFLAFTALFLQGFLAISVHSYWEVKVMDSMPKEKPWTSDQWFDWILWGPLYKCIFDKPPGSSRGAGDEDSSDEDGDDDDDDEDDKD